MTILILDNASITDCVLVAGVLLDALGNSSTLLDLSDSPTKTLAQPPPQPIDKPSAAAVTTGLDDQLLALGRNSR